MSITKLLHSFATKGVHGLQQVKSYFGQCSKRRKARKNGIKRSLKFGVITDDVKLEYKLNEKQKYNSLKQRIVRLKNYVINTIELDQPKTDYFYKTFNYVIQAKLNDNDWFLFTEEILNSVNEYRLIDFHKAGFTTLIQEYCTRIGKNNKLFYKSQPLTNHLIDYIYHSAFDVTQRIIDLTYYNSTSVMEMFKTYGYLLAVSNDVNSQRITSLLNWYINVHGITNTQICDYFNYIVTIGFEFKYINNPYSDPKYINQTDSLHIFYKLETVLNFLDSKPDHLIIPKIVI